MARMGEARAAWGETAASISDPAPMLAVEKHLTGISTHTAETVEQTRVLAETTRETYGTMRAGAQSAIPGLHELSAVVGGVGRRFTEIGVAAKASLTETTAQVKVLTLETERLNLARLGSLEKLSQLELGSRAWTVETGRLERLDVQLAEHNALMATAVAEQKAAARGASLGVVGGKKALAVGGGVAAAGVAVAAVVGYESVKAAMGDQAQLALLRNAIGKTKESWEDYLPALESVDAQMRHFGYADKDTAASAQRLTTALHDPEKALNLVGLAANIARGRNIDLATATGYVTKIATGHVGSLGRLGLATKDAAGNTLTASQAIDSLGKAYSGAAQSYSGTLQGKLGEFKAQAEHVFAAIGIKLIPVLSDLVSKFADAARWINANVVPSLRSLWDWFEAKIVPAIQHVVDIMLGAYHNAFDSITKAANGHGQELHRLAGFFKAIVEILAQKVLPIIAHLNAVFVEVGGKAIGYLITAIAKLVDAFRAIARAAGNATSGVLDYFVRPTVKAMLWMAEQVVGAADHAFGWIPGLGHKLDSAKASIAQFARDTDNTLAAWSESASHFADETVGALTGAAKYAADYAAAASRLRADLSRGDDRAAENEIANIAKIEAAYAAYAAAQKKQKPKEPSFNIDDDYSAGVKDVAEKTKKVHEKASDEAKKRAAALKKALAEQAARLKEQAAHALAAAKEIAEREAAQLRAALAAALEAARQLDVANKLATRSGNLDLIDGQMFNRGSSFAQLAADQARGATINLNIAGRVTTERDLIAALHEGLLTYGRTNISTGLA